MLSFQQRPPRALLCSCQPGATRAKSDWRNNGKLLSMNDIKENVFFFPKPSHKHNHYPTCHFIHNGSKTVMLLCVATEEPVYNTHSFCSRALLMLKCILTHVERLWKGKFTWIQCPLSDKSWDSDIYRVVRSARVSDSPWYEDLVHRKHDVNEVTNLTWLKVLERMEHYANLPRLQLLCCENQIRL